MEKIVMDASAVQDLSAKALRQAQMIINITTNYTDYYEKNYEKKLFIFILFVFGIEVALSKKVVD
ncbi:MAG: hypothetical protein MRK01_12255 [Candidatus Scalindua sp.]|nr:hypothetical protein [Candidatus Scalindua sp.]